MAALYPLAESMARPVACGYLSLTDAHGALLAGVLRAKRRGMAYDVRAVYRGLQHILDLRLAAEDRRRALCELYIKRRLRPLILRHMPSNVLYAEAHDINGAEGFPLAEHEVADLAAGEMYWALPADRGGRRYAR